MQCFMWQTKDLRGGQFKPGKLHHWESKVVVVVEQRYTYCPIQFPPEVVYLMCVEYMKPPNVQTMGISLYVLLWRKVCESNYAFLFNINGFF